MCADGDSRTVQTLVVGLWRQRVKDVSIWASFQRLCLLLAAAVSWQRTLEQLAMKLGTQA